MCGCHNCQVNSDVITRITQSHYDDVIMSTMASQISSLTGVYSSIYSGTDQRKHQSSESLAFVRGIHRGPVNSPHKGPVTRKMLRHYHQNINIGSDAWCQCVKIVFLVIIYGYFSVYLPHCFAIQAINIKITLWWVHKHFPISTHALSYIYHTYQ